MDRLDQILFRLERIDDHLGNKTSKWLTIDEAAGHLKVSIRSIRRYLNRGMIPRHKLPNGCIRIERTDLDSLLMFGLPYRKLTRPQKEKMNASRDL